MNHMIRISIHLMDDPADMLVSETEHDLMTYRDAGDRLKAGVMHESVWLPIAVDEATLDRWFAKERAEAMVP